MQTDIVCCKQLKSAILFKVVSSSSTLPPDHIIASVDRKDALKTMASIPACQLNCLNGGYCDYISSDESTLIDTFARGGLIQRCICLPGFGGISCENKVEQCSTELKCQNGVPCALDEKTGKHYCDCSYADLMSLFAGKMCREPATSYCGQGDIKNRSFCTHGGLCQSNINRGVYFDMSNKYSTHKGCACPPEFEGVHCEFLKGTSLDDSEQVQIDESAQAEESAQTEESVPTQTEPAEQNNLDENEARTEDIALAPVPSAESAASINYSKESNESNLPVAYENILPVAPSHDKTPVIEDQPTVHDQPSKAPPVPDNASVDLEAVSKETFPSSTMIISNIGSTVETNRLGGSTIAIISLTVVVLIVGLLARRRIRKQRNKNLQQHFVLGDNYRDETPIRVQVFSELEQPNELDEVLGMDEYENDDDMRSITERSESSLEEIELDYPTNGDEEDEFDEPVRHSDYNPFAHIIGPRLRSSMDDAIV